MLLFSKLFCVILISYLNRRGAGVMLTAALTWVLGQVLGDAARCIFLLDLSHGFAWELNRDACRAENTWWRARVSISEWFWMNASIFLHRQLWIFVSIFYISCDWLIDCFFVGGTGTVFPPFFVKIGHWRIGDNAKVFAAQIHDSCFLNY